MREPGLQAERTFLAWHRTAWALLVTGALLLRGALTARHDYWLAMDLLWGMFAVLTALTACQRNRHLSRAPYRHCHAAQPMRILACFTLSTSMVTASYCIALLAAQ